MKILSWNINSLRLRIGALLTLVRLVDPDVICLQETKVINEQFPHHFLRGLGYNYLAFQGQKSYNGVAICSRLPIVSSYSLSLVTKEARHIAVKIGSLSITNIYVPAGGDVPDVKLNPKFQHKISFLRNIKHWFQGNLHYFSPHILLGDFNIAPEVNDVWSSRALRCVVSHTDLERELLLFTKNTLGFVDVFRNTTNMNAKIFTWWSYRNKDWKKSNRGRRLDHIWVTPNLHHLIRKVQILKFTRDWLTPSDHVPCFIEINN